MNEKSFRVIKIIIVIGLIVGALIFKFIPEYKESIGSSDSFFTADKYDDVVEFKIDKKISFSLIITDNNIVHILFFSDRAMVLYNQNIENMTINDGIEKIVELIVMNGDLKENSTVVMTQYNGKKYEKVKKAFLKELNKLNLNVNMLEYATSLEERAKDFEIIEEDELPILKNLDLYSKDIISNNKNYLSDEYMDGGNLSDNEVKKYADNVYKKLEDYVSKNNINNQDIGSTLLPINLIPADNEGKIYPDSSSQYYIEDGKVYAYISITDNGIVYSYCYEGTIDNFKKGQC